MIPKIIHYVWIGDSPLPKTVRTCIESWKKYCPDFEIKQWGNEILAEIDNRYVSQALEYKKWAFVSDYIRLYVLYRYGGFYLDTDCEITASIDEFTKYSHVLGLEEYGNGVPQKIATSFWGCEKNDADIKALLDEYKDRNFIKEDGELDLTANVHKVSDYFEIKYNFNILCHITPSSTTESDRVFCFGKAGIICPTYYFCKPLENKKNFAIHHFAYTWEDIFKRILILKIGKYKLVKFSQKKVSGRNVFPLMEREKIIFKLHIGKRYFCVTHAI